MWIFLSVLGALALIIAVLLCLPVYVIIKSDKENGLLIRYRFFGKTYGDGPSSNNEIVNALKKAAGLSRLEKKEIKTSVKSAGVFDTVRRDFELVLDLLKKIVDLLRTCVVKKLKLKIVCAKPDAADTAISYGKYCAIVNPVLAYIHNFMKVRKRGQDISITCDYNGGEEKFDLELVFYVRVFRIVSTLIRVVLKEANRISDDKLKKDAVRRKKSAAKTKSK